jgi:hypothetical protein
MPAPKTWLEADPDEVARTLALLYEPGDVVEVRAPNTPGKGTVSGYFDALDVLAACVCELDRVSRPPAIYVVLNPCQPALLARAANHLKPWVKVTTKDSEILTRRWVLIDCDPVRPVEISSSDSEHASAIERAREIRFALAEKGWPQPVLADSGNGAHLVYRIDLGNDEASARLVQGVLQDLARRFSDLKIKIDQTVYNAAQPVKLYGTVARKGDNIAERPHRVSRLLEAPL